VDGHYCRARAECVHHSDGEVHGNRLESLYARGGRRRREWYAGLQPVKRRHRTISISGRVRVHILGAVLFD